MVAGVPGVNKSLKGLFAASEIQIINFQVKPTNLPVTVNERGTLESAENQDVFCQVEGQTTIIMIVPEGKRVTKGELVCELDSSALKDNLKNQEIATLGAEAAFRTPSSPARSPRSPSASTSRASSSRNWETVLGEIALADSELKRAEDRLDWSDRMFKKGYVSMAQNVADKVSLAADELRPRAGPDQEEGAREVHQGQDDQGAQERGREGALRRARQASDLGAGEGQGGEARAADHQLQAPGPRRRPGRLRQRPEPASAAAASRRSRKVRRSASGRRSSACPTSARCGSTPRSTSR